MHVYSSCSNIRPAVWLAVLLGSTLIFITACDPGSFGDMNDDPTRAAEISPEFLLTRALVYGSLRYDVYQRSQHLFGSMYSQQFSNLIPNWPTDRYESGGSYDDWATAFWRATYSAYGGVEFVGENVSSSGVNTAKVIELTSGDEDRVNINAQARIWKVFLMHRVTDFWGDVPYSEAFRGEEGIRTPAYDAQEDIYRDMLATLQLAASDLTPSITEPGFRMGSADVLYGDDLIRWRRFANSLRLRLAMRTAHVDEALARTHVEGVLDSGDLMQSNDDSALMVMGTAEGRFVNQNPMSVIQLFEDDRVSATLVDMLVAFSDPRLSVFAARIANTRDTVLYRGLPNGLSSEDLARTRRTSYSKVGEFFREPARPQPIMLYPEVAFLRAEAALRGWSSDEPGEWYEEGIRASLSHFGIVHSDSISAYLSQAEVAWQDEWSFERKLEAIITQKWLAIFPDGFEAWAEYRRTGFPDLMPVASDGETGGAVPSRVLYPQEEYNVNRASVEAAASRIGGDQMTTRLWWDVGRAE